MSLGRGLVLLALAVALVALGVVAAGGAENAGRLVVRERHVDNGRFYIEGAISYVVVRRVDGTLTQRTSFAVERRMRLDERLPSGRYRLTSYVRPCEGTCQRLDPPTDRCAARFRLRSGRQLTATIRTAAGEPCRISFR